MILVADSGSTKCDWMLENADGEPIKLNTIGFNPMFHNEAFIVNGIKSNSTLTEFAPMVSKVFYYGASVSSEDRKAIVVSALQQVFGNAQIEAFHDLTGAVRATAGREPGVVCILGTGSNSCLFDGNIIHENIPALGYVLGDEAGGAWFGREFLRQYLYGRLDSDINADLSAAGYVKEEIYRRVYRSDGPNVYLASLMPLIHKHKDKPAVRAMLETGFHEFIRYHVQPLLNGMTYPVHFVGSVGLYFQDEIREVCEKAGITCGKFTNEPVKQLYRFHTLQPEG